MCPERLQQVTGRRSSGAVRSCHPVTYCIAFPDQCKYLCLHRSEAGGHVDCLTNCISLRSVRCSGGQQGTLSAAKKPAWPMCNSIYRHVHELPVKVNPRALDPFFCAGRVRLARG